jgi:hypothetical protein
MLVLAMFLSIGSAAVLFLLRFLFALNSEISSEQKRSLGSFDHITAYRISSGDRVSGVAPALTLVWRQEVGARPDSRLVSVNSRERNSQLKEA